MIHQLNIKGEPNFGNLMMKPRSLNSVTHRFRKVKSLRQLRKWKKQTNRDGSRVKKLKDIYIRYHYRYHHIH